MSAATPLVECARPGALTSSLRPAQRLTSIDVFRGLTILTMIFVNDLSHHVNKATFPWWMRHMPVGENGMTFVDVVFPAFLFIVGMSIPLALARRKAAGDTGLKLAAHVLLRTLGLLIVGVFMVNMSAVDPAATGLSNPTWTLLLFTAVILLWNRYPKTKTGAKWLYAVLRAAGAAALIWLAATFHGRDGQWMHTQWWGILGLIGWSYLTACIVYALAGGRLPGLIVGLTLLVIVYCADPWPTLTPQMGLAAGHPVIALDFLGTASSLWSPRGWVWIGGHIGTHSAITVAGMIVCILVTQTAASVQRRAAWLLAMAACLFASGYLMYPLYGIGKNETTPTFCLYTSAICTLLYLGLWLAIDVAGTQRGWGLLKLGGANPLLAYVLPYMIDSVLALAGITWLNTHLNAGTFGVSRSLATAVMVVLLAGLAYRLRIRLQF